MEMPYICKSCGGLSKVCYCHTCFELLQHEIKLLKAEIEYLKHDAKLIG